MRSEEQSGRRHSKSSQVEMLWATGELRHGTPVSHPGALHRGWLFSNPDFWDWNRVQFVSQSRQITLQDRSSPYIMASVVIAQPRVHYCNTTSSPDQHHNAGSILDEHQSKEIDAGMGNRPSI